MPTIKDTILETLKIEEANQAHKIIVSKEVPVKKQFPIKVHKPVKVQVPLKIITTTEHIILATETEPEKKITTQKEDIEMREIEEIREFEEFEEREVIETQQEEQDSPAFFDRPHEDIALEIHNRLYGILKLELQLPQYEGKTDQEILDILDKGRLTELFIGIPYAPNAISLEDIAAIKAL